MTNPWVLPPSIWGCQGLRINANTKAIAAKKTPIAVMNNEYGNMIGVSLLLFDNTSLIPKDDTAVNAKTPVK